MAIKGLILAAALIANVSWAQSYSYQQGAIFEQSFVTRIDLATAGELLKDAERLTPYLDWEWDDETIATKEVKRVKDRLVIALANQQTLSLKDFSVDSSAEAEGDFQEFQYLQSTADFHIIGVLFGHDQPAFLLVSKAGDKVYFVDTHQ